MRGLIIEMASLLAIVVGIYGAIHFSFFTARLLGELMPSSQQTIEVVAFGLTLIVLMLAVMFLAKMLTKMLKAAELGFLNRLAGALFGVLKAAVIVGSLFVFLERTFQTEKWLSPSALNESVLYEPVKSISAVVYANVF
jgi:colicin V production protein